MPRVALTEDQRRQQRYADQSGKLADGLAVFKRRTGKTNKDLAAELGMGNVTVGKLLHADTKVAIPISTVFRLLDMAELEIKKKEG